MKKQLKKSMKLKLHTLILPILVVSFLMPTLAIIPQALANYSRFTSWGVSPNEEKGGINLPKAWRRFEKKKDVVVAVIDTGIHPEHSFIKSNIHVVEGIQGPDNYGMDFSLKKSKIKKKSSSSNNNSKTAPKDTHGHGTHVTGIIKSIFPAVKILTLKYYNPNASGQENLVSAVKALRYAVDKNVDIINYSGGGPEMSQEEFRILKLAEEKGILIVAAAGNEKSNIDNKKNAYYPASYQLSNIITVTAHNKQAMLLSFANYGKFSVDISAPGHKIRSSLPHGQAGNLTGTSQATAFVTGTTALIKSQFPHLSAIQIKKIIRASARKRQSLVDKCITGGILDAKKALEIATRTSEQSTSEKKHASDGKMKRNVAEKNVISVPQVKILKRKNRKKNQGLTSGKEPRKVIYYYRGN